MDNVMQESSFEYLIKQCTWSVPEIQREYVWGSNSPLLEHFLKDIADQVLGYNIGFLYSYTPHIAREKSGLVHLIDGQQRFTSLYLAAFYFSLLAGKTFEYNKKFSYRVRNSTAEFLTQLLDEVKSPDILSKLEDQTWFLSSYRKDPSINNICSLFKWLNEKYKQFSKPEAEEMLKKIMGVQFWNFNLNKAKQGEELYITMNSRGESLSGNENIRAYLLDKETLHNKQARGKEFDIWQEFFWQHRGFNPNADRGFNTFLASVIFIELHKTLADNSTDKPLYTMEGFQKIVGDLYNSALKAGLTFEKIRPYYEALERLTTLMTSDGLNKITPKLLEENGKFETYLSGHMDRQGLVFLLPLLAFYAGHPYAKTDARWVRFFYNIAFNQEREALQKMLKLAANAGKEGWVDTIDLVGSPDLDEEEKIKLEQLKAYPSQREELEKLYQKLEDHPITKGFIASFINRSLDKGQLDIERLEKYSDILWGRIEYNTDRFRRALLAVSSYGNPNETFGLYDGYTYAGIEQHRYHFCNSHADWARSFKEKSSCYFILFDRLFKDETLQDIIDTFIKNPNNSGNAFYYIIKNPSILQFSSQKRFTFDLLHNEVSHVIRSIKVMLNTEGYCLPAPFFSIKDSLSDAGISVTYEDNCLYVSIANTTFELWYNYDKAHPKFSLWIERKNISKLQGKLGFKPENDWHYIDNLKTENEVLALIEQIKQILM